MDRSCGQRTSVVRTAHRRRTRFDRRARVRITAGSHPCRPLPPCARDPGTGLQRERRQECRNRDRAREEDRAAAVRRLFSDMSVELAALHPQAVEAAPRLLAAATRVLLVHLPRGEERGRVALAERLLAAGLSPVPHVAARRIRSHKELAGVLRAFREVGVRAFLVIAGDGWARGPFPDSLVLLDTGLCAEAGIEPRGCWRTRSCRSRPCTSTPSAASSGPPAGCRRCGPYALGSRVARSWWRPTDAPVRGRRVDVRCPRR